MDLTSHESDARGSFHAQPRQPFDIRITESTFSQTTDCCFRSAAGNEADVNRRYLAAPLYPVVMYFGLKVPAHDRARIERMGPFRRFVRQCSASWISCAVTVLFASFDISSNIGAS